VTRISERFLAELRNNFILRKIETGIRLLDSQLELIEKLDPKQHNAGEFLGELAIWADAGYDKPSSAKATPGRFMEGARRESCAKRPSASGKLKPAQESGAAFLDEITTWADVGPAKPTLIKALLGRFKDTVQLELPLREYLGLCIAQAFVAMGECRYEDAIRNCNLLLGSESLLNDNHQLSSIFQYWLARCSWYRGRNEDALNYVRAASRLALTSGYAQLSATIRVLEGWIVFHQGGFAEAKIILAESQSVLEETEDYVGLGNIHSAVGLINLWQGNHCQAAEEFAASIQRYRKRDVNHKGVARSLMLSVIPKRQLASRAAGLEEASAGIAATPKSSNGHAQALWRQLYTETHQDRRGFALSPI
jgi:tetratricopeptide (TPR) repeat protein